MAYALMLPAEPVYHVNGKEVVPVATIKAQEAQNNYISNPDACARL